MPTSAESEAADHPAVHAGAHVTKQVRDAIELLDYAVESGFKSESGRPIPVETIATIQTTAGRLGLLNGASAAGDEGRPSAIPASDWVEFERAYYSLATIMRPITAETLRDTEGTSRVLFENTTGTGDGRPPSLMHKIGCVLLGFSPAQRFTRGLWLVAIGFGLVVIGSEWGLQRMALAENAADDRSYRGWRIFIELIVPWAYGGLGSCVYLLRSAHVYIYQRSFDLRRKPEYFNRILLGTFAGGAIILFVNQIAGEDGTVIQLSAAALGFLAGYSTDFLFNTIERIIAALLPKVGADTVKRGAPAAATQLDVRDLADRYDQASGPAKEFYKSLMEHVTGARTPATPSSRQRPAGRGGDHD